ncbi:hypothetical protein UKMH10_5331 [Burkholderia pseudomallei]|nr:hypothetical protein UKMH10_5331 [Burkholderia pseudomallei]
MHRQREMVERAAIMAVQLRDERRQRAATVAGEFGQIRARRIERRRAVRWAGRRARRPAPSAAPVVRAFAARESASGGVGARDDTVSSRCRNDSRGAGAARSPSTPRRAPISGIVCRRALATRATSADRTPPGPDARRAPAAVTAGVLLMDEVR